MLLYEVIDRPDRLLQFMAFNKSGQKTTRFLLSALSVLPQTLLSVRQNSPSLPVLSVVPQTLFSVCQNRCRNSAIRSTLKFCVAVVVSLCVVGSAYGQVPDSAVCERTMQVRDAIVASLSEFDDCNGISTTHLATITTLDLSNQNIQSLQADDFAGLSGLVSLDLSNNAELTELPAELFDGLSLTSFDTGGVPIAVSGALPSSIALTFDDPTTELDLRDAFVSGDGGAILPAESYEVFSSPSHLVTAEVSGHELTLAFVGAVVGTAEVLITGIAGSSSAQQELLVNVTSPVCDRTAEVRDAIVAAIDGVDACQNVTLAQMEATTDLGTALSGAGLTALKPGDFSNLSALLTLDISNNNLTSLPEGLLDDMRQLQEIR